MLRGGGRGGLEGVLRDVPLDAEPRHCLWVEGVCVLEGGIEGGLEGVLRGAPLDTGPRLCLSEE